MYKSIKLKDVKELLEGGNLQIVDIRDETSYHSARIANSVRIDQSNLKEFLESADKDKQLLCYCYHGIMSVDAARFFSQNGFKEVYSLEGGFEAWQAEYPHLADNQ